MNTPNPATIAALETLQTATKTVTLEHLAVLQKASDTAHYIVRRGEDVTRKTFEAFALSEKYMFCEAIGLFGHPLAKSGLGSEWEVFEAFVKEELVPLYRARREEYLRIFGDSASKSPTT